MQKDKMTPRDRMAERLEDAVEEYLEVEDTSCGCYDCVDEPPTYGIRGDYHKLADQVLADALEILNETPILIIHEDGRQDMVFPRQAELEAENEALKAELAECQATMRALVAFYQAGGADQ